MLHLGGARTALFAYLYAKRHQGQFILRIEDTDRERSTEQAVNAILHGLEWLGLTPDEGPFYQTQRLARYQEVIDQLLEQGQAYRCYCSKERLEKLRESQLAANQKPRYDGCCRDLPPQNLDQPHVVRFKNPQEGAVTWEDQILGEITVNNSELDDFVIARSDKMPTYNFAVVVDDADMNITEVVRGNDHINNTPRQINLFNALGFPLPKFAHLPMILNEEGKKLSKRDNAANILMYRDQGFLPEALVNYLVRLGWSHGDQEIFSLDEMVQWFDFAQVQKSPARINPEKLLWLNQQYLMQADLNRLSQLVAEQLGELGVTLSPDTSLSAVVQIQRERCKTVKEIAEKSVYFYQDFTEYDEKAANKNLSDKTLPMLEKLLESYQQLHDWRAEPVHQVILETAEAMELKLGKVAQPLRVAVTGGAVSPPLDVTLCLLGRVRVIERLEQAIHWINRG